MQRSKLLGIVCVIAMMAGLLAGGCAGEAPPTEGPPTEGPPTEGPPTEGPPEVFELTFCNQHPYEAAMNYMINEAWINWLEEESGGRIKVTLLHSSQCAAPADIYDAARTGIVDIGCAWTAAMPGRFPIFEVTHLPSIFTWPDTKQICLTANALYEKYPEIQEEIAGVKVICFHSTGTYHMGGVDKPIHTMEDMEGLLILAFGRYAAATVEALGGKPGTIDILEAYDALAKGTFDGINTSCEGHIVWHWEEICNYYTQVSSNITAPFIHVMNLDTWNSLPADLQALFVGENAMPLMKAYGHQFDEDDQILMDFIDEDLKARGYEGVYVLPEAEEARWIEAGKTVWEEWISEVEPLIGEAKARAILEDAQLFAEQYKYTGFCQECEDILHGWGAVEH